MRSSRLLLALFALLIGGLPAPAVAAVRVVATVPDLAALARAVGGDEVKVTSMALPTQDPHFVDARPDLALALSRADLLLRVGLDLEVGWLPVLLTGSRNPQVQKGARGYLDCSRFVEVLEVPTGRVDRSMGDIHPGGNPHYLHDPRMAVKVARGIADRLASLDSANAAHYRSRVERFATEAAERIRTWEQRLAGLKGVPVVAYHKSWPYLENWVGFEIVAWLEPKPGIPPSPAHLARVLSQMQEQGVRMILQEAYYPRTTSETVAGRAGVPVAVLPGGADFNEGETYLDRVDRLVEALTKAAGGA